MDIFILLIISIFVYLLPVNNDYLGVKSTSGLKGFLALGIVFHHLSQWVTTGTEFSNFGYMGTYIVSVFFFLSGYGLYVQNEKKENYLDNFQAVDKCRNCMSQQPVLMRKSAKNVII